MPRNYTQTRRAESTESTRNRILAAAVRLHAAQGVEATSYREVAEHADVSIGSVYHHFPSRDDLVVACSDGLWRSTDPPDVADLEAIASFDRRVEALVQQVFGWYKRYPSWRQGAWEAEKVDSVARSIARREQHLRSLVGAAIGDSSSTACALARAVIDYEVYRSLRDAGLTTKKAAKLVSALLLRSERPRIRETSRSAS